MTDKIWRLCPGDEEAEEKLSAELGLHPLMARLLVNRGIVTASEAKSYLFPALKELHDPALMPNMAAGVERILLARQRSEPVVVYGDYDVDGVTGAAILYEFFNDIDVDVSCYLPHRKKEGYGLNEEALRLIAEEASLLVTVDNGVSAVAEVAAAKEMGLDVVITDHHLPPEKLPEPLALINPLLPGSNYPDKTLSGAGVGFKLCMAIRSELHRRGVPKEDLPNLKQYLDLVAIGAVADLVPLTGENRIMVKTGLEEMARWLPRPGVAALMKVSGCSPAHATATDISFGLAPRLNAAGRMGSADTSLELLLAPNGMEAEELAEQIDLVNTERKEEQARTLAEAEAMLHDEERQKEPVILLGADSWSSGVVGIVASQLAGKWRKPVFLAAFDGGKGRGSVRSLPGFHATDALAKCGDDSLLSYGGHELAAGFSLEQERFALFRKRLMEVAAGMLEGVDLREELKIDAEVDADLFDKEMMDKINQLAPFGEGAPAPLFVTRQVQFTECRYMGQNEAHVRLTTKGKRKVVGFGWGDFFKARWATDACFDLVFTPEINRFNGIARIQLLIKDVTISAC